MIDIHKVKIGDRVINNTTLLAAGALPGTEFKVADVRGVLASLLVESDTGVHFLYAASKFDPVVFDPVVTDNNTSLQLLLDALMRV